MKTKASSSNVTTTTPQKLKQISNWVATQSLEWSSGIKMLLLCLVTERNGFFLGPPGVGKTQVIRNLLRCFDGYELFAKQLNPEMPLRELVGYLSIPKFVKDGVMEYVTQRSLVMQRGIGFLGEIWLGNGSVLNGLLGIANEGIITLGSQTFNTNVILIGDSNEMPDVVHVAEGDVKRKTLVALADRFLLRERRPAHVRSMDNRLLLAGMASDKARTNTPPVVVTEAEMSSLTQQCRAMVADDKAFPLPIKKQLLAFVEGLRKNGIRISDRRWMWSREVLAASALLDGRTQIEQKDLKTARFWGWLTPAHITVMNEVLQSTIDLGYTKAEAEVVACGDVYEKLVDVADKDPSFLTDAAKAVQRTQQGNAVSAQLSDSIRRLNDLVVKFPDEADEILPMIDNLKYWNRDIVSRFVQLGGISGFEDAV